MGPEAQFPKIGSLYTKPGSILITNMTTPAALPEEVRVEIFLAPQTDVPVTGVAWEFMLKYNCTEFYQRLEFTIPNRRINSSNPGYISNYREKIHFQKQQQILETSTSSMFWEMERRSTC